ncbi:hypothetical protein Gotur_029190 [Gossypium turneri]
MIRFKLWQSVDLILIVTPQNFNFGYCECVIQTSVSFSGYVFWECLGGSKFKSGLGKNRLIGLVDKWSVGVREVMGSSLWDGKCCIFAPNFGKSCVELGF